MLGAMLVAGAAAWAQEPPVVQGPKHGFRDMKWGDPPPSNWKNKLKGKTAVKTYTSTQMEIVGDKLKVLGEYPLSIVYSYQDGGLCGVEVRFSPAWWEKYRDGLVAEWGQPAVSDGDGRRFAWTRDDGEGATDATLAKGVQTSKTQMILGGPELGKRDVLRVVKRGCGSMGAASGL